MTQLATINNETMAIATPEEKIEWATRIANAVSDVVEKKNLYVKIKGKKHLTAEAWETVIALADAHPVIEWTRPVKDNGLTIAYEARAVIYAGDLIVASGEMVCGMDEFPTRGQEGYAKHRAAMSAAQTWAVAKAARTKYAWIVTLADYAPTPSDEIPRGEQPERAASATSGSNQHGTCPEHDVAYFQSRNMRSPAHKTEDGKWCNKPPEDAPQRPSEAASEPESTEAPPDEERGGVYDEDGNVVEGELFPMDGKGFVVAVNALGKNGEDTRSALGMPAREWVEAESVRTWEAALARCRNEWAKK